MLFFYCVQSNFPSGKTHSQKKSISFIITLYKAIKHAIHKHQVSISFQTNKPNKNHCIFFIKTMYLFVVKTTKETSKEQQTNTEQTIRF
jgi:hypothetical protein